MSNEAIVMVAIGLVFVPREFEATKS